MKLKRRALVMQYGGLFIVALIVAVLFWNFPVLQWLSAAQKWVEHLGPASVIAYPILYAICNVLLLPGGVLTVGAGFFFGLWWGSAVVLAGNVLGAAIAILIARTTARKWVERKLMSNPRWRAMDEVIGKRGGRIVFLSQLHPLFPTSLLNYFYGITRLPFWSCVGWIALGQIPGTFLYAYFGTISQHGLEILQGTSHPPRWEYLLWINGFLATLALTIVLARISISLLKEIDERAAVLRSEILPASSYSTQITEKVVLTESDETSRSSRA